MVSDCYQEGKLARMYPPTHWRAVLCAVHTSACLLLFMAGCGPADSKRASVSGRVTFNGEPLAEGAITFTPHARNEGPPAGGTIRDGEYSIGYEKGPVIGKNRVEISAFRETGKTITIGYGPGATDMAERVETIPAKYNENSELIEDLIPGPNTIDFELKD